jgi:hypothetical protein
VSSSKDSFSLPPHGRDFEEIKYLQNPEKKKEQILLQGKKFVFSRQGWVIVYSIPFAFL